MPAKAIENIIYNWPLGSSLVGVVHANRAIRGNSIGRALSIARGWRVERLQPYDLEVMDEECEFDNWINHYILLTRLLSLYICCGVGNA